MGRRASQSHVSAQKFSAIPAQADLIIIAAVSNKMDAVIRQLGKSGPKWVIPWRMCDFRGFNNYALSNVNQSNPWMSISPLSAGPEQLIYPSSSANKFRKTST